jgi:hypothetical protein
LSVVVLRALTCAYNAERSVVDTKLLAPAYVLQIKPSMIHTRTSFVPPENPITPPKA